MLDRKSYLGAGAFVGIVVAWACGPDFGISILGTRQEAVLAAPAFGFYRQLSTLVPKPADGLPDDPEYPQTRQAPAPPPAYQSGAVSYHERNYAGAKRDFAAVLQLAAAARGEYDARARFMLGKIAMREGDAATARARFADLRTAVKAHGQDPDGLAVASLGEEALLHWQAGEVAPAVALYAQQAAHQSRSGRASLIMVGRLIMKDAALLDRGIQDPLTRQLLFVCLNARQDEDWKIERVVEAMERHQIRETSGAGLLAAAAYARGNFTLAERLAGKEAAGAAAWVRAKLALRRGDRGTALVEFDRALAGPRESGLDADGLAAETAVLRLARGDYAQALTLLRQATGDTPGDYWADAAYLAERVMTSAELRRYVDEHVPARRFSRKDEWDAGPASVRLRALLARRLMREGQLADAVTYFDDVAVARFARDYRSALERAQSFWRPAAWRAEAWLEAARLARHNGMDLLAFEGTPDGAIYQGNYGGGEDTKPEGDYVGPNEVERFAASASRRNVRFQYRLTAVDYAMKAADLVPARSEGFAATLCEAASWVQNREPQTAKAVYARYVKQGAWVPWAGQFPKGCPSPRLESETVWRVRIAMRQWSRRAGFDLWPWFGVAASGLLVTALVVWLYRPSAR